MAKNPSFVQQTQFNIQFSSYESHTDNECDNENNSQHEPDDGWSSQNVHDCADPYQHVTDFPDPHQETADADVSVESTLQPLSPLNPGQTNLGRYEKTDNRKCENYCINLDPQCGTAPTAASSPCPQNKKHRDSAQSSTCTPESLSSFRTEEIHTHSSLAMAKKSNNKCKLLPIDVHSAKEAARQTANENVARPTAEQKSKKKKDKGKKPQDIPQTPDHNSIRDEAPNDEPTLPLSDNNLQIDSEQSNETPSLIQNEKLLPIMSDSSKEEMLDETNSYQTSLNESNVCILETIPDLSVSPSTASEVNHDKIIHLPPNPSEPLENPGDNICEKEDKNQFHNHDRVQCSVDQSEEHVPMDTVGIHDSIKFEGVHEQTQLETPLKSTKDVEQISVVLEKETHSKDLMENYGEPLNDQTNEGETYFSEKSIATTEVSTTKSTPYILEAEIDEGENSETLSGRVHLDDFSVDNLSSESNGHDDSGIDEYPNGQLSNEGFIVLESSSGYNATDLTSTETSRTTSAEVELTPGCTDSNIYSAKSDYSSEEMTSNNSAVEDPLQITQDTLSPENKTFFKDVPGFEHPEDILSQESYHLKNPGKELHEKCASIDEQSNRASCQESSTESSEMQNDIIKKPEIGLTKDMEPVKVSSLNISDTYSIEKEKDVEFIGSIDNDSSSMTSSLITNATESVKLGNNHKAHESTKMTIFEEPDPVMPNTDERARQITKDRETVEQPEIVEILKKNTIAEKGSEPTELRPSNEDCISEASQAKRQDAETSTDKTHDNAATDEPPETKANEENLVTEKSPQEVQEERTSTENSVANAEAEERVEAENSNEVADIEDSSAEPAFIEALKAHDLHTEPKEIQDHETLKEEAVADTVTEKPLEDESSKDNNIIEDETREPQECETSKECIGDNTAQKEHQEDDDMKEELIASKEPEELEVLEPTKEDTDSDTSTELTQETESSEKNDSVVVPENPVQDGTIKEATTIDAADEKTPKFENIKEESFADIEPEKCPENKTIKQDAITEKTYKELAEDETSKDDAITDTTSEKPEVVRTEKHSANDEITPEKFTGNETTKDDADAGKALKEPKEDVVPRNEFVKDAIPEEVPEDKDPKGNVDNDAAYEKPLESKISERNIAINAATEKLAEDESSKDDEAAGKEPEESLENEANGDATEAEMAPEKLAADENIKEDSASKEPVEAETPKDDSDLQKLHQETTENRTTKDDAVTDTALENPQENATSEREVEPEEVETTKDDAVTDAAPEEPKEDVVLKNDSIENATSEEIAENRDTKENADNDTAYEKPQETEIFEKDIAIDAATEKQAENESPMDNADAEKENEELAEDRDLKENNLVDTVPEESLHDDCSTIDDITKTGNKKLTEVDFSVEDTCDGESVPEEPSEDEITKEEPVVVETLKEESDLDTVLPASETTEDDVVTDVAPEETGEDDVVTDVAPEETGEVETVKDDVVTDVAPEETGEVETVKDDVVTEMNLEDIVEDKNVAEENVAEAASDQPTEGEAIKENIEVVEDNQVEGHVDGMDEMAPKDAIAFVEPIEKNLLERDGGSKEAGAIDVEQYLLPESSSEEYLTKIPSSEDTENVKLFGNEIPGEETSINQSINHEQVVNGNTPRGLSSGESANFRDALYYKPAMNVQQGFGIPIKYRFPTAEIPYVMKPQEQSNLQADDPSNDNEVKIERNFASQVPDDSPEIVKNDNKVPMNENGGHRSTKNSRSSRHDSITSSKQTMREEDPSTLLSSPRNRNLVQSDNETNRASQTRNNRIQRTIEEQAAHERRKAARRAARAEDFQASSLPKSRNHARSTDLGVDEKFTSHETAALKASRSLRHRDESAKKPKLLGLNGESIVKIPFVADEKPHIKEKTIMLPSAKITSTLDRSKHLIDGEREQLLFSDRSARAKEHSISQNFIEKDMDKISKNYMFSRNKEAPTHHSPTKDKDKSSSHRPDEKDKDRVSHRPLGKDKEETLHHNLERNKDKSSSHRSHGKDKDRTSSHRSKEKDKDRVSHRPHGKDKEESLHHSHRNDPERSLHRSLEKDKDKSSSHRSNEKDKDRVSHRPLEKDKEESSHHTLERNKDRSSSHRSHGKDKERTSHHLHGKNKEDSHHALEKDKDRSSSHRSHGKDKEESSHHTPEKNKDKSSSHRSHTKDKDRSSSHRSHGKDKEESSHHTLEKDKEISTSIRSSEKEKDKSLNSTREKDNDVTSFDRSNEKERDRTSHRSHGKDKERSHSYRSHGRDKDKSSENRSDGKDKEIPSLRSTGKDDVKTLKNSIEKDKERFSSHRSSTKDREKQRLHRSQTRHNEKSKNRHRSREKETKESFRLEEEKEAQRARRDTETKMAAAREAVAAESRRRREKESEDRRIRREERRKRLDEDEEEIKVKHLKTRRSITDDKTSDTQYLKTRESDKPHRQRSKKEKLPEKSKGPLSSLWSSAKKVFG
ncbi:hypothetical protein BGT96224_A20521 [Blumeria graminis f. sp. tritici 96224]|uniref:Uncharacterized protein n=1 Tax=Blumeria graminis f. sp. tritici 96224 TaxID=1268274 RepID=A0A656KK08_BLUGR|nr:hypothetical protein BGT96224_A20521 [Blumeria graminis f. sp. tritici 96224]